ncbi:MAG: hypothetical protein C4288_22840, partial [Leptolyngbya sp. ERB_1_1]
MSNIIDLDRMIYIAGDNQVTFNKIQNFENIANPDEYKSSMHGDGTVPHQLGLLQIDNRSISTYYVEEKHDRLPSNTWLTDKTRFVLQAALREPGLELEIGSMRGG